MGIRSLLVPFAYAVAVILKKARVSISAVVLVSFFVIFSTIFSFYMVTTSFYIERFELLTIAGIFLTGFMDEVIRELSRMKKLPTFPLALARHSDLLLVFGILYISMVQPYGLTPSLNIDEAAYPVIGAAMLFGVLIADIVARKIGKRDPGLESRAERMYLLTGFTLIGIYFNEFLLSIVVGVIGITAYLYMWTLWKKFHFLEIGESLYIGLSKLWKRASAVRPRLGLQKAKVPFRREGVKEDFQEYEAGEYTSTSGYNFTVVVNNGHSEPVSDVKVSLLNVDTGETYASYTDPSGRTGFISVSEGQYNIALECEGFKKTEFERYVSMDSGEVFTLKRPYSDLSIVISDKNKTTPVPNADVSLKLAGKDQPTLTRRADNLGVAYFDELDIGTYGVHVTAEGYADWQRDINLDEENVVSVTLEQAGAEPAKTEPEVPEPQAKEEEPEETEEESEVEEEKEKPREEVSLSEILADSVLFEYSSPDDVRSTVSRMVEEYKKHDMEVFLVSTPERTEEYQDLDVETVDMPSDPEQFKDVLEGMPAGSALIFEPLSNLILTAGFDATFKFVKKTLDYTSGEGLSLACFLNPSAHDEKEVEKMRKLLNSVTIEGDGLFIHI